MIDHDRLFKELLSTFFVEFLELFLPQVVNQIDRDSIGFLPQEYFADLTTGETKIIDLLAQVQLASQETGFLVHVENQAATQADFSRRMFFYFARLHQNSGKVLADVRWSDYGLVPKAVEIGTSIHMGKYFGLSNQLLMLFATLVVILLAVSGAVMWWQRRPKESSWIGAPALPTHVQQWRVPLAIVTILGLVFPLVGFSLLTVLLLDYFILSRNVDRIRLVNYD
jgi:uncharacterized iron-regulated membrane protein